MIKSVQSLRIGKRLILVIISHDNQRIEHRMKDHHELNRYMHFLQLLATGTSDQIKNKLLKRQEKKEAKHARKLTQ